MARRSCAIWLAALALSFGCGDGGGAAEEIVLKGRVFTADTGKPLKGSTVMAPGGKQAATGADGAFEVSYLSMQGGSVRAESKAGAPVTKPAPKKGGYIELHVKQYDALAEVAATKGGAVETSSGAHLKLGGDALTAQNGEAIERATLKIAVPNPTKVRDLPSIPGNFAAKKTGSAGKLSTESPVYVGAHDGDRPLKLKQGARASIDLPVHARPKAVGATASLYYFDEAEGVWVEHGTAQEVLNAAGTPVYRAEVETLGWWTVGEFYDELGCLRGCVQDSEGNAVASARVLATGVDYFGQISVFTETDGCYTVEVRASSEHRISAQIEGGFAPSVSVSSGRSDQGSTCVEVPTLTLVASPDEECPLGFTACGEQCVELGGDTEDCGGGANMDGGSDSGAGDADSGPGSAGFFPLIVSTEGAGVGIVTSMPDGIACGDLCSADFEAGSEITLHAQPTLESHTFAGWSGDCAGSEPTCVLTMNASRFVTASFSPPTWQLNVWPSGTGSVAGFLDDGVSQIIACDSSQTSSDCSEVVPEGTAVTLVAQPPPNMTTVWSGGCVAQGLTCTLTVLQTTNVDVSFVPIQYTLTLVLSGATSPGPGSGTVALTPPGASCAYNADASPVSCQYTYDAGTAVTLTATPMNLNFFEGWGGACADAGTASTCTLTIGGDTSVSGAFGYIIP